MHLRRAASTHSCVGLKYTVSLAVAPRDSTATSKAAASGLHTPISQLKITAAKSSIQSNLSRASCAGPGEILAKSPVTKPASMTLEAISRPSALSSKVDSKARAISEISPRSEEHTSELQSRFDLVCRLLLE